MAEMCATAHRGFATTSDITLFLLKPGIGRILSYTLNRNGFI
ncbi:hypothetical protein NOR51B_2796 [Luminiphilus syltensis NOR5-1B]|uniref:Uncharacterized protein n=1 Tax=Luminiphilus syltensis NOR5-1B TaxID=565045 RepID=B8KTT2_9GAMM|nr:hypothetical protein NOR51B_2796 [Luminiphilus syltensis NOR5-1B]